MDTNPKHPLQVIYESMLEDPSYYNGDWVAKYLTFVKETVPDMMKKELLSDHDVELVVTKQLNDIASYGNGKTKTSKIIDHITPEKLLIFFKNCRSIFNNIEDYIYINELYSIIFDEIYQDMADSKEVSKLIRTQLDGEPYVIINRMLSAVFPQYLGTIIKFKKLSKKDIANDKDDDKVSNIAKVILKINNYINNINNSAPTISPGNSWLEYNKNFFDYCNKHIKLTEDEDENKEYHISLLLDYLNRKNINTLMEIYKMKSENIILKETSDLLLQTKNLILTGAPGTGKTYLAKQIADELTNNDSECVTMVQFHPSYDYTDFVEGLRPIDNGNGEIGFERKDGEFKKFCKEALINSTTQSNSIQEFDIAWRKLIEEIENKLLENGEKTKIANVEYDLSRNRTLRAHPTYFTLTKENIFKAYQGQKAREKGGHQNYMNQVVDYLKTNYNLPDYKENDITEDAHIQATSTEQQNFVFIIDEINRGEISKIFGELFFAIDPGYRGENGRIKTQYQNLLEGTDDTFEEGFYVPENVYIIGTMNDIDRSVDSFDFAMRRRFAWKEITAEDTQHSILDSLQDDKRNEAINRMNSLNKKISGMLELGTQYQLGASYFLKLEHYDYDFEKLWHYHIKGLLYEYLRGVNDANNNLELLREAYDLKNEQ